MTEEHDRLRRHLRALAAVNRQLETQLRDVRPHGTPRASLASAWVEQLAFTARAAAPALVRRADGAMFVVEGPVRRAVPSGLIAAAIADHFGDPRDARGDELERCSEGPPVEVLEGPRGAPFVVVGGRRLPLRGLPLPHPVTAEEMQSFPEGPELNVAAANVARSRFEEALSGRYQLRRVLRKLGLRRRG
jgi:hypothetical protein